MKSLLLLFPTTFLVSLSKDILADVSSSSQETTNENLTDQSDNNSNLANIDLGDSEWLVT